MIKQAFDAGWEYTEGGTFFGMLLAQTQPVTLPHDASIGKARRADHPSGPGGAYTWNGVVSYCKRFHAPIEWQGQRVQLEFEGVTMHAELTSTSDAPATAVFRSTIRTSSGATVAQDETTLDLAAHTTLTASQQLPVADAQLRSVDTPHLYTLTSEVLLDGAVVDRETTRFGIRSIAVDPTNGYRLNGVPLKLKGGCVHHDHGLLGAASYDRAEEREVELLKSVGFNALRSAHNPPAPALLDACDRLGMLVIDESFDMWRMGKSTNDYHLYFEQWWQRDTEAMVKRDRNHPSVIMWSIGNEILESTGRSDGYAWSRKQADSVRALDPTRLVTQALPLLFDEVLPLLAQGGDAAFAPMVNAPTPTPDNDRWGRLTEAFAA